MNKCQITSAVANRHTEATTALGFASLDALMALGRELVADLLLGEILVALHAGGLAGEVFGLPSRGADVLDAVRVFKHRVHLFEGLACSLWEHKEDVDGHSNAEHSEDDVGTPGDVDKGGRNEVTKSEVEGPVTRGGQRHSLTTEVVREQLRRVDPGDRTPGRSIARNKQV